MRRLNLDDLVSLGAGLATEELNGALSQLPFLDIRLSETSLFGLEKRELFDNVFIEDLNTLQAGLTHGLGEKAFATQVNQWRLNTLQGTPARFFAESSFKIGSDLRADWELSHASDALGSLGFYANPQLEAMVIAPYAAVEEAVYNNPLSALQAARGFILPQNEDDILKMAPGSSVTLRGDGALGFNLGVGVPLVTGLVTDYVTLSARISAGARVSIQGDLDVQLIKGMGQDVYVDVGLSSQQIKHYSLALESGWGVEGLPVYELNVAGVNVNLTEIVEGALEKQLNQHLSPLDARRTTSQSKGRLSVARFKFNLSNRSPSLVQALRQSLKGDLRLAQALGNRPNSGVMQELSLNKTYEVASDYLGFRFLSMRFFKSEQVNQGIVYIDQNGRNQELLFKEIEQKSGLFFTDRGSKWRQVTSVERENNQILNAHNNARLTLLEHDRFLSKDQILDHVDPLLSYFLGFEGVFYGVNDPADRLFKHSDHFCGYPPTGNDPQDRRKKEAYEECVINLEEEEDHQFLSESIYDQAAAYENRWIDSDFGRAFPSSAEITRQLLDLKTGLSGIHDRPNAHLDGPKGTLISQFRFSDEGILSLMAESAPEQFRNEVAQTLMLMHTDRDDDMDDKIDEMEDFAQSRASKIDPIVQVYQEIVRRFDQYHRISNLKLPLGDGIGNQAHLLLIPADSQKDAQVSTIAELKGNLVGMLFGELENAARGLREPDLFVLGYSLLKLTQPNQIELMVNFLFEADHDGKYDRYNTALYSRGESFFINAGQFNLDEILKAQ
jgi:hypothetical protein